MTVRPFHRADLNRVEQSKSIALKLDWEERVAAHEAATRRACDRRPRYGHRAANKSLLSTRLDARRGRPGGQHRTGRRRPHASPCPLAQVRCRGFPVMLLRDKDSRLRK